MSGHNARVLRPGAVVRTNPDSGDRKGIYVHPGQLAVSAEPAAITTVLGSCVAVCLFDPVTRVGGLNHFLLPLHVERERSARFGSVAVPLLIEELRKLGANRAALQAKVFGGGSIITAFRRGGALGDENVTLALRLLAEAGIPVLDKDVGGQAGRKVIFHTDDGTAWVRCL